LAYLGLPRLIESVFDNCPRSRRNGPRFRPATKIVQTARHKIESKVLGHLPPNVAAQFGRPPVPQRANLLLLPAMGKRKPVSFGRPPPAGPAKCRPFPRSPGSIIWRFFTKNQFQKNITDRPTAAIAPKWTQRNTQKKPARGNPGVRRDGTGAGLELFPRPKNPRKRDATPEKWETEYNRVNLQNTLKPLNSSQSTTKNRYTASLWLLARRMPR